MMELRCVEKTKQLQVKQFWQSTKVSNRQADGHTAGQSYCCLQFGAAQWLMQSDRNGLGLGLSVEDNYHHTCTQSDVLRQL